MPLKALFLVLKLHSPMFVGQLLLLLKHISKMYLIRIRSFIGDLRFSVRGEHMLGD